jgi:hypothetical protein
MGKTATCRAKARFLDTVVTIPGVQRVVVFGGETTAERSILVFVPSLEGDVAEQVFELEGQVLRDFRGARLDVEVNGVEELGITDQPLDDWVPEGAVVLELRPNVPARKLARAAG